MELERLRFLYSQVQTNNPVLPSESERRTFVVAETRAGMAAYGNSRIAVPGLYALIDITPAWKKLKATPLRRRIGSTDAESNSSHAPARAAGAS